jgi:hypothetical protein
VDHRVNEGLLWVVRIAAAAQSDGFQKADIDESALDSAKEGRKME